MASVLIAIVHGLPAAGKTTLCAKLVDAIDFATVVHLDYDNVLPQQNRWATEEALAKRERQTVIAAVELWADNAAFSSSVPLGVFETMRSLLPSNHDFSTSPIILLVDDTMYYRSMRYAWYQLARKRGWAFCEIFVSALLAEAKYRNAQRGSPVLDAVMDRIYERLEPTACQSRSLTYESDSSFDSVLKFLESSFHCRLEATPPLDHAELERSRQINRANLGQQLDQTLRKLVAETLDSFAAGSPEKKRAAKRLVIMKATILEDFRRGKIVVPQADWEFDCFKEFLRDQLISSTAS